METPGDEAMFVFERGRGRRDERDDEDDDCDDQGDDDGLLFFFSRRRKNESQGSLLLSLFRSCFKTSLAAPLRTERQKTMDEDSTQLGREGKKRRLERGGSEIKPSEECMLQSPSFDGLCFHPLRSHTSRPLLPLSVLSRATDNVHPTRTSS